MHTIILVVVILIFISNIYIIFIYLFIYLFIFIYTYIYMVYTYSFVFGFCNFSGRFQPCDSLFHGNLFKSITVFHGRTHDMYICTCIQCMVDIYIRYTHTHTDTLKPPHTHTHIHIHIITYTHAYIHTHTHIYKHQTTTLKAWVSRCCTRPSLGAWLHTGDGVRNVCRTSSAGSPVRAFFCIFCHSSCLQIR